MSSLKVDARSDKTFKKRTIRSPLSTTAAETLVIQTKHCDKPDFDLPLTCHHPLSHQSTSDVLKKTLRRTQSSDYLKLLTEKTQEIKKLQENNHSLAAQISDLSSMMKKYHKLRGILKEKDQVIESLRSSVEKLRFSSLVQDEPEAKKSKKLKKLSKVTTKFCSRLSLDSGSSKFELINTRPSTVAHKIDSVQRSKNSSKAFLDNPQLSSLLTRTESILKGWKKAHKHRKPSILLNH